MWPLEARICVSSSMMNEVLDVRVAACVMVVAGILEFTRSSNSSKRDDSAVFLLFEQ